MTDSPLSTRSGVLLRVHKRDRAIEHRQDCEGIVEHIKSTRGQNMVRDWGRPVCEVPNVFVAKWLNEEGVNLLKLQGDELRKFIVRKGLTDPDFRIRLFGKNQLRCRSPITPTSRPR